MCRICAWGFRQFSTAHSNGTNKVIDTPCTFLLSSAVYTEAHPRRSTVFVSRIGLRDAAHAARSTVLFFSNSFRSYSFRTLASHLKANVSSNSLEINRFRTLCEITGIGYPPLAYAEHSPRRASLHFSYMFAFSLNADPSFNSFIFNGFRTLLRNGAPQPPCFQTLPDSFHCNGGVYPPRISSLSACLLSSSPKITHMLEIRPSQMSPLSSFTGRESPVRPGLVGVPTHARQRNCPGLLLSLP